jgi:DNA-binding NtrC family response regulator
LCQFARLTVYFGQNFKVAIESKMARVMIYDDDLTMAEGLAAALRDAGHDAEMYRHMMDALRAAGQGCFDLIAFSLDTPEFGRARAIAALREIAPLTSLIAFHNRPSEIMRADTHACLAAVLPRPVAVGDFMYAVARVLRGR